MKRAVFAVLILTVLGSGGGCCCLGRTLHHLKAKFCGHCGSCAGGCQCAPCDCGDCYGGRCGQAACGHAGWGHSSCGHLGCGEMYWGDHISVPPRCCDPCDSCGNWIGPSEPLRVNAGHGHGGYGHGGYVQGGYVQGGYNGHGPALAQQGEPRLISVTDEKVEDDDYVVEGPSDRARGLSSRNRR